MKTLTNSLNISLHAASIVLLLLPLVWFSGGLNVESNHPKTDPGHSISLQSFVLNQ